MRERPGEAGAAGRPALQFPSTRPNPGSVHQASQEPELGFWPRPRHKPVLGPPRQFSPVQTGQVVTRSPPSPAGCDRVCVLALASRGQRRLLAADRSPGWALGATSVPRPLPHSHRKPAAGGPRDIAGRVGLARTPFGSRQTICEGLRNRQGRRGGDPPFYPLT